MSKVKLLNKLVWYYSSLSLRASRSGWGKKAGELQKKVLDGLSSLAIQQDFKPCGRPLKNGYLCSLRVFRNLLVQQSFPLEHITFNSSLKGRKFYIRNQRDPKSDGESHAFQACICLFILSRNCEGTQYKSNGVYWNRFRSYSAIKENNTVRAKPCFMKTNDAKGNWTTFPFLELGTSYIELGWKSRYTRVQRFNGKIGSPQFNLLSMGTRVTRVFKMKLGL